MNRVELVYDRACPHVVAARVQLREALRLASLPISWREWDRAGDETPAALRPFGSPTILVDGRDVAGEESATALPSGNSCRLYRDAGGGVSGVPPLPLILAALEDEERVKGPS